MIEATELSKTFYIPVTKEGRFSGIRSLFSRESITKVAVHNMSFTIAKGEFVGYIGPNGAGKSTTIKMLTGILHPTSGEVKIRGISPHLHRRQVVARLGVVFGQRSQLWWDLPVKDSYEILAAIYKIESGSYRRRLDELTDLLDLQEFLTYPVRKLSLGQRMKADLAAALLHDPDVIFLDEPTIGLDVTAKKNIRSFLKKINHDLGKTILLTTHDMDDIEELCQRVMVINHGKLAYDGTISGIRERIGLPTVLKVAFQRPPNYPSPEQTSNLPFMIEGKEERNITVHCNRNEISAMEVLRQLQAWGEIADIHMEEPDIEEVIHRIYNNTARFPA